jgi:hypothetical protein
MIFSQFIQTSLAMFILVFFHAPVLPLAQSPLAGVRAAGVRPSRNGLFSHGVLFKEK